MDEFVEFRSCLTQQKFSHTAADSHSHTHTLTHALLHRVRRNLAIKSHFYFGQGAAIEVPPSIPAHFHTCRRRTRAPAATCGGQSTVLLCSNVFATETENVLLVGLQVHCAQRPAVQVPRLQMAAPSFRTVYRLSLCLLGNISLTQWSVKLIVAAAQLPPERQRRRHSAFGAAHFSVHFLCFGFRGCPYEGLIGFMPFFYVLIFFH